MPMRPLTLFLVFCGLAMGCERPVSQAPDDTAPPAQPHREVSIWDEVGSSQLVSIEDEQLRADLKSAMHEARETAEDARRRWEVADERQRTNWGVKWAAETAGGGVEYLWVEPLAWSPFRIEGLIANHPQSALECGKGLGELVSFPIEQLADWLYLPTGDIDGPREGGFTLVVIEESVKGAGIDD